MREPRPSRSSDTTERPSTSPVSNRSLERGLELLRAFGPGATLLGNGDLVELTGLPKATVSRLARTLVETGYLEHDAVRRGYRLGLPVLGLAQALRNSSTVLQAAAPRLRETAQALHINVGIAGPDRDDMVYLESIRYSPRASLRTVVSGQRVPMALTSLGRAYLASLPDAARSKQIAALKRNRQSWPQIRAEIDAAVASVHAHGFCVASWQPEVAALAAPLEIAGHRPLVLNFSVRTADAPSSVAERLAARLLELRDEIVVATLQLDS
ncbi:IclR family transcriptional regulator [Burkholderia cenocepacia]|uniref:IclR family transcriptional regulator n=1 Tax=Burkholderia cenocepacia TaxID=95486 RepID=UPI0009E0F892|nr:IclR family transcriptional regulator [Burkholderia cenocepacia]ARF86791.1 IclR family transcriptional regulator [Burkholderia cenocepacia]MCW3674599.1 IclR family transcriptional regulator [Burkholderia cenocepacia]MDC6082473.1 IclR family transcriptional regulator [Burkholderia cenocepacia]SPV02566.1 IclR family transcriptional regulator [Burkholderia cenocepacia]